jgi:hypothetical protein
MKTGTSIKIYAKAFFILLVSGWRTIEIFGYPPVYDKNDIKTYLVTSGDGTIIDHCQYYGKKKGKHQWQQAGFPSDLYPNYRNVLLWKPLNNTRRWSYFACR